MRLPAVLGAGALTLLADAVVTTIAGTCSADNARLCLALAAGQGED